MFSYDKIMYVLKVWYTKKDYDNGESIILSENYSALFLTHSANCKLNSKEIYAAEVYEKESGETYFHSEE